MVRLVVNASLIEGDMLRKLLQANGRLDRATLQEVYRYLITGRQIGEQIVF